MKKIFVVLMALVTAICFSNIPASGAEHDSKEHGGKEHGGEEHESEKSNEKHAAKEHGDEERSEKEQGGDDVHVELTADDIRSTMKAYVGGYRHI